MPGELAFSIAAGVLLVLGFQLAKLDRWLWKRVRLPAIGALILLSLPMLYAAFNVFRVIKLNGAEAGGGVLVLMIGSAITIMGYHPGLFDERMERSIRVKREHPQSHSASVKMEAAVAKGAST